MQDPAHAPLELHAGDLRLALRPDLGGSVAGLWHRGEPVLRSTEAADLPGPRQGACFAMLPYSNRLGGRRFEWQGVRHTTLPNFEGSPHSLHGVGWLRHWQVAAREAAGATLRYRHLPDGHWPFAFEAEQRFELTADALQVELRLTNTDLAEQPAGLGWHPYFPKRAGSRVQMAVTTRWEHDALQLPTGAVPQAGIDGPVADLAFDHCFGGWSGPALIDDACFALRLSSTLPYAVVFTPAAQPFFCVEPVSHVNNAIQQADPLAHGLVRLPTGQTLAASMRLDIARR